MCLYCFTHFYKFIDIILLLLCHLYILDLAIEYVIKSTIKTASLFIDMYVEMKFCLFIYLFFVIDSISFQDEDDTYQYRHVILDKNMASLIPKNRLMDEYEWRALGIKQGPHWEHYLIHEPGKIFCFSQSSFIDLSIRTICSYVSPFT